MNRSHSSDSLDNGLNDVISSGSSSPTNFTSDDEETDVYGGLFPSAGQPSCSNTATRVAKNKISKYSSASSGFSDRLQQAMQTAGSLRPRSSKYQADDNVQPSIASTSYYSQNEGDDPSAYPSHIPDVVPSVETIWDDSPKFDTQGAEGYNDNNIDIFRRRDQPLCIMGSNSRPVVPAAGAMCSRLVSCRTLPEAMEFIEANRDTIDDVTRIIREGPAFRDYDMSNYQIDHSVKESFNPHFWLDREPVLTTADGNCQYHAVSLGLTGSEGYTQEVRLATAVAVVDHHDYFDSVLKLIDRGSVLDLVHTIARSYSWGDETTLKAIAVAIKRRIFLYTCNIGKKDYEMVKTLSKEELLDAFKEKKYRGGTGIHTYADPLTHVSPNNYIMLFHKTEHFIAVLATNSQPTMFEPYNPIVPTFS